MARAWKMVCVAALLIHAGVCMAGEGKADQRLVQKLMQKSGINKQVEQFPEMLQAGMNQANQESPEQMTKEQFSDLSRMAVAAFNAKALKDAIQKSILANLPEKDIRAALAWLNSPLGEKITRLEEAASTPAAFSEMQAMADELAKNTGRVAGLKKLESAVKATEAGVSMALNTQVAMVAALTVSLPAEQRPSVDEIKSQMDTNRAQIQTLVEQQTLLSFLYAYRTLTDTEIDKYIAFAESESGKKYHTVTLKGLNDAVLQASRNLGTKLGETLGGKKI